MVNTVLLTLCRKKANIKKNQKKPKKLTDPEFRVNVTKSISVLVPSSIEIHRTIHPSLNHLKDK